MDGRLIKVLFALALLCPISLAFTMDQQLAIWSGLVILIVLVLLAAALMLARFFAIPEWEAWVRSEFAQVLLSAFLIIVFTAFGTAIDTAAQSVATELAANKNVYWNYNPSTGRWLQGGTAPTEIICPSPCHIYIARAFMGYAFERYGEMFKSIVILYSKSLLVESIGIGGSVSFVMTAPKSSGVDYSIPLWAGRAIYNNALRQMADVVRKQLVYIKLQEMFLLYVPNIVFPLFALGIILRIPFFTRKLGGLMVAIAMGLYFIFPLTYILGWYTLDISTVNITESFKLPNSFGELSAQQPNIKSIFEPGSLADCVSRIYLPAFFLPVLSLLVLLGFVKHLSPMIGGDTEIAGLSRII
ncbi:MAG: hypothetical protein QW112_02265 [Candidatus Micrarchaeia archaeon]